MRTLLMKWLDGTLAVTPTRLAAEADCMELEEADASIAAHEAAQEALEREDAWEPFA